MLAIRDQHSAISRNRSAHSVAGVRPSAFGLLPSGGGRRRGFTLVELLVVITILAILASLLLFALAGAQETAIEMRTRSTITKLNAIITQKYESYRTRRLPLTSFTEEPYTDSNNDGSYNGGEPYVDINGSGSHDKYTAIQIAQYRLDAVRDLMRLEMPDSFGDVQDDPITKTVIGGPTVIPRPAANLSYKAALDAANSRNGTAYQNTKLQQAMCLYLIVSRGTDDPDVMEQFATYEVKTDPELGLSYFVDGWGNPIFYLRWAPAYVSPLQPGPTASSQRDPFDPMQVEPAANQPTYPLYPLIYSPGADGNGVDAGFGITASLNDSSGNPFHYGNATVNNDPFYNTAPLTIKTSIGLINDASAASNNITNHDIETR